MRYIVVGDLHIRSKNILEIMHFKDVLLSMLKPDIHVVLLGDILHFHDRVNTNEQLIALDLFQSISSHTTLYVLVGNHDMLNNSQFLTNKHWMNAFKEWKNIHIIDYPTRVGDTIFVPYVPNGRFKEALTLVDYPSASLIFAHQEIRGCKMNAITSEHGDVWGSNDPLVISGHIHLKQCINHNIIYPGALLQNNFGDDIDRFMLTIDTDTNNIDWIPITLSKKQVVSVGNVKMISDIIKHTNSLDAVKINLEISEDEFKKYKKTKEYRELPTNIQLKLIKSKTERTVVEFGTYLQTIEKKVLDKKNDRLTLLFQEMIK